MGQDKTTYVQQQATTPTATPEERELQRLEMERQQAVQPGLIQTQQKGLDLISQLLAGEELPGYFGEIGAGISPEMTGEIARESIKDLPAMFQQMGVLEGGVAPEMMSRVSGDVRRGIAEFNVGAKQNLLNLAFGGQAQVQQPLMAQSQMLSQRLAGLRPSSYSQQGTQTGMSPFMRSFQQGLGQGLGGMMTPSFRGSMGPFQWGG